MTPDAATVPLDELDTLWDFDDPAVSERRFAALLLRARSEDDGALLAEALTQLARARGLQGRFDEADAERDADRPVVRCLLPSLARPHRRSPRCAGSARRGDRSER